MSKDDVLDDMTYEYFANLLTPSKSSRSTLISVGVLLVNLCRISKPGESGFIKSFKYYNIFIGLTVTQSVRKQNVTTFSNTP